MLSAEGVLDQGWVVQIGRLQYLLQALGLGVDAALAAGLDQQAAQLVEGQSGGCVRGGGGAQQRAGFRTQDAAALGGLGFPTPERWRVIQGPGGHRHPGCEAGFQKIPTAQTLSRSGIAMLCVHGYPFPGWIDW